jgi:hypothetical protein
VLLSISGGQVFRGLLGEFTKPRLRFLRLSFEGSDFPFYGFRGVRLRAPTWIEVSNLTGCLSRSCLGNCVPSFLRGRRRSKLAASQSDLTRAATRPRRVLRYLRANASTTTPISPSPARAATARRNTRLIRVEAGFDGALEVAQLDLHHLRAKQPVQAMEMRIDGVGMHEAVPLSDPADRVSALVLAG